MAYSVFRVHLSKYLQCENFPYTSRTQNICTIFAYPCESLASVMYEIAFCAKNSMRRGRGVGAWAFKSQDLWNWGRDWACSVQLVSVLFAGAFAKTSVTQDVGVGWNGEECCGVCWEWVGLACRVTVAVSHYVNWRGMNESCDRLKQRQLQRQRQLRLQTNGGGCASGISVAWMCFVSHKMDKKKSSRA